jgi:hypothetical protein
MKRRKISPSAAQIKDEIRKLNRIEESEFHRSFNEEAAVDLVLRIGVPGDRAGMPGMLKAVELSISTLPPDHKFTAVGVVMAKEQTPTLCCE